MVSQFSTVLRSIVGIYLLTIPGGVVALMNTIPCIPGSNLNRIILHTLTLPECQPL